MRNLIFLVFVSLAVILIIACDEGALSPNLKIKQKVSIQVDLNAGKVIEPGYRYVDNSGVVHVQGRVTSGEIVSGDLVGTFVKTTIINAEYDPDTGNGKELMITECDVTWSDQKLSGLFVGERRQEFTNGDRTSSTFDAEGKEGFSGMDLELTFEERNPGSGVLSGKGRIIER